MLVVLVGGLVAGAIVAWNVTTGLRLGGPGVSIRGGDQPVRALVGAQPGAPAAQSCRPEKPPFDESFGELQRRLASEMGDPGQCAQENAATGDLLQQTTTGLAVKRTSRGLVMFTNGVEHWALASGTLLFWTGPSTDPPADAQRLPAGAIRPPPVAQQEQQPPSSGGAAVVAGTDGTGLVLRASPRDDDWTPRGFMDGTRVEILERNGSDWARIRGENGQEGWVPAKYLRGP